MLLHVQQHQLFEAWQLLLETKAKRHSLSSFGMDFNLFLELNQACFLKCGTARVELIESEFKSCSNSKNELDAVRPMGFLLLRRLVVSSESWVLRV